jgi:choline-sulfatase
MLTGRHPYRNEVWTNRHILHSGIPTFAHAMGAVGYRPVLIGRMHSLGPDQLHGYVERLVGDHGPNYLGGTAVDRGALRGTAGPDRISLEKSGPGQSAYQVHDEYVTAATVDYLNRLGVQKRSGQLSEPFCLTAGFMLPHPPYVARREDYDLYRDRMTMPRKPGPFSDDLHPHLRWWREQTGIVDVGEEASLRARTAYWGLVTRLDALIGQILDALHANSLADNTLIVYTSDHGDMVGEHGLWWKHTFYEESAKVPLLVSWPGVIPAGQRKDHVVNAVDVTATMLDALGAPALPNADGKSFLHLLTTESDEGDWRNLAFSEYCSDEFGPVGGCYQRMVRLDEWKLVYYYGQEPQLFNLEDDPDELVDRAGDPACQAVRRELTQMVLEGWHPGEIAQKMAAMRDETEILRQWAQHTRPTDQFRWNLVPTMNFLEEGM